MNAERRWDTACALTHSPHALLRYMVENGKKGNVLEVGCAGGGSALALMGLVPDGDHFLVTVDPWGNRPYETSTARYGENFQRGALAVLGQYANDCHLNWHHFKMDSLDFMMLIQPLGCWYAGKKQEYRWDTVFLDGEHTVRVVLMELNLVRPYLKSGAVVFVDNANHAQDVSDGGVSGVKEPVMQNSLAEWAKQIGCTCEFVPYPEGDLLAVMRF
jgi:predicted O-methyltransferase YrrM